MGNVFACNSLQEPRTLKNVLVILNDYSCIFRDFTNLLKTISIRIEPQKKAWQKNWGSLFSRSCLLAMFLQWAHFCFLLSEFAILFHFQVDKWFGNARWGFRRSSRMGASPGENASPQATGSGPENTGERERELASQEVGEEKLKTPSPRKRKHLSEPQASEAPQIIVLGLAASPGSPRAHAGNKKKTVKRKWCFVEKSTTLIFS